MIKLSLDPDYESKKKYRENNRGKCRKANRNWNRNHINHSKEYNKNHPEVQLNWAKKNRKIRNAEQEALRHVSLAEFCELCSDDDLRPATERHHPDYDYPLIVVSVCDECHKWIKENELLYDDII